VGIAKTDIFDDDVYRWHIYLAFAGDRLAVAMDGQVRLFDVVPIASSPVQRAGGPR
jgi:hypothetical protein